MLRDASTQTRTDLRSAQRLVVWSMMAIAVMIAGVRFGTSAAQRGTIVLTDDRVGWALISLAWTAFPYLFVLIFLRWAIDDRARAVAMVMAILIFLFEFVGGLTHSAVTILVLMPLAISLLSNQPAARTLDSTEEAAGPVVRTPEPVCRECGYDLSRLERALPRCPECGTVREIAAESRLRAWRIEQGFCGICGKRPALKGGACKACRPLAEAH